MAGATTYNDNLSDSEVQYQRDFDRGTLAVQRARAAGAAKQAASQAATSGIEAAASRFGAQGYAAVRIWQFLRKHPQVAAVLMIMLMVASILVLTLFLAVAYALTDPKNALKIGFEVLVNFFFPKSK